MDKLFDYANASKYAYSVATVRYYETKLLSREKVMRMLGTDDVSECFRMLEDAGYQVNLGSHSDFNPILASEYQKTLDIVSKLAMDDRVHALLAIKHDFHNIKVAAKESFSKDDLSESYKSGGIYSVSSLKSSISEEDFTKLGRDADLFAAVFAEIKSAYEENPAPRLIDIVTDRLMYADLLKRAKDIGNGFVTRIFVKEIDLINVRTFFRLRYLSKKRMDFVEAFIAGGDFHLDFFLKNYEDDFYQLKTIFKGTEFLELITEGSTYIEEHKSFLRFERLISEYKMKYISATKWASFGMEPIVSYYYAKEKELQVVRMILMGKTNALSSDEIREGIPDEYI